MIDQYQTRKTDYYSIIDRKETVAQYKPLEISRSQYDSYIETGYLLLKGFVDTALIRQIKSCCCKIAQDNTMHYVNYEPNTDKVRSVLSVDKEPIFSSLLDRRIINISRSILGAEIYIHQSRINFKLGNKSNGWNWHSDFETWHSKDGMPEMKCLTAMFAIDDNTVNNGCLNVLPKSHRKFISCPSTGPRSAEQEFSEQAEGVPDLDSIQYMKRELKTKVFNVICEAGDLLIFDCNLLHYSGENTTENSRINIYYVLNSIDNKLLTPFSGGEHRPNEMGCLNPQILS